jgi:hypothetical protein
VTVDEHVSPTGGPHAHAHASFLSK